jgi:hypothetical protein
VSGVPLGPEIVTRFAKSQGRFSQYRAPLDPGRTRNVTEPRQEPSLEESAPESPAAMRSTKFPSAACELSCSLVASAAGPLLPELDPPPLPLPLPELEPPPLPLPSALDASSPGLAADDEPQCADARLAPSVRAPITARRPGLLISPSFSAHITVHE